VTITLHTIEAVLNVGLGYTLDVVDATITLDDSWSPYVQATMTCWTPEEDVLDLLDPRDSRRVVVTVSKAFGDWNPSGAYTDQERVLNLLLRGREVDHNTGRVTITLESDEALLQDFGLVATAPEHSFGLSVKEAVTYALAKVGALLAAGAADAEIVTDGTTTVRTNGAANPCIGGSVARLSGSRASLAAGATYTRATITDALAVNVAQLVCAASAPADMMPVTVGQSVTVQATGRASAYPQMATVVQFFTSSGAFVTGSQTIGVSTTVNSSTFTPLAPVTAVAPATAAYARWLVGLAGMSARAIGDTFDVHNVMIESGAVATQFFSGDTPDSAGHIYAWTGTAKASTSTHTADSSDAMTWQPGVTGWDFVEPLLQATGLRLYCNEARQWILQVAGTPQPGQLNISEGVNVTQGADTISRARDWYDSVVVAYLRNQDVDGKTIALYDAAGAPGSKMLRLEYDRAYPGPGAAQAVLDRAQGRGRVLALEAISDYTATPGMTLSAALPDSPVQVGVISSVAWSFPDDRMTIGSRGLTDTPPTSWLFATVGRRWQDIPVGTDWTEYTP